MLLHSGILLLMYKRFRSLCVREQVLGLFAAYSASLFAFTSLVPLMLLHSGSAALNLSLLTSDFWAAGARALFFGAHLLNVAVWLLAYTL